jgi:hypothetical protein
LGKKIAFIKWVKRGSKRGAESRRFEGCSGWEFGGQFEKSGQARMAVDVVENSCELRDQVFVEKVPNGSAGQSITRQ